MPLSSNFGFLSSQNEQLAQLGALAERYFRDDPATAIFKLRQFAELLSKVVAARHAMYLGDREAFEETLRRLSYERIIPKEAADVFHALRKAGNSVVHEARGNHSDALSALKFARQLGIWFYRTYGKQPDFKPGTFVPPAAPIDATADLKEEIENLRRKVAESEDAAVRARREAEEHARARESVEQRLVREAEERAVWEQLAQDIENEKSEISARLVALQSAAEQAPKSETVELIELGEQASTKIDLDEAATRTLIDQQLRDAGWEADTKQLRYGEGSRPAKGRNMAIAEWPTKSGPADYALFAGLTLMGVVEAKRKRKNVSSAIDQAERYSVGLAGNSDFSFAGGPWKDHKVPFVFAANGRSYLKQIETESGIWFRVTRRAANHRRALADWLTPEGLIGLIEIDQDAATEALKTLPFDFGFPLRDYQQNAIEAVEKALEAERRTMLLAMATGTGKTKLAIAMLYRLLATKRFRRICFVVDRSALGIQAAGEFSTTKIVSGKAFADIFGLKKLEDVTPYSETKVHICTIQGLVKRVLFTADDSEAPPIDQYDLIVVDECHRGYLLDREMSDAELSFRGQDDYISKYRRVLEYFDAIKIGLTATPALHTTDIFGDPIFTYSYRDAVVEGHLIDHEPPIRIETALARAGIVFEKDEQLDLLNTKTGEVSLVHAPDEIRFDVEKFNKKVITPEFNRVVAEELAKYIDPALPGKTLIFAATDAHADIVVSALKKAFQDKYDEIDDAAVKKITGSVDHVQKLIRSFRNDANPKTKLSKWFASRSAVGPILDWKSDGDTPRYMPISHHADEVVSVTHGYGDTTKPEDFLDSFVAYVRNNVNNIAALKLVVQRPRDLTRADLKELRMALDLKGYSEVNLRRAWADAKNEDIAASIIGFVRQAALGDPLVPYGDRLKAAMRTILASKTWSAPQKSWLKRIGEQIEKSVVIDRETIDTNEPFASDGGFKRLNKVFDGELGNIIAGINEEMWKRTG